MINKKPINLFGLDLVLTERYAWDVLVSTTSVENMFDLTTNILMMSKFVEGGLKYNYLSTPWYNPLKKFIYKRKLNHRYLSKHLSIKQLSELANEISILEGGKPAETDEDKKKVDTLK